MKSLSMDEIASHKVPAESVTLWWLGQAGFIIKSPAGKIVALDPYLSNSCKEIGERVNINMDRQVPPPLSPSELVGVDLCLFTHSHQDHRDPETLERYRASGGHGPFLAPAEAYDKLLSLNVPEAEVVKVWPNKRYVLLDLLIQATFAIPFGDDDLTHVGYLIVVEAGPTVYFTGDTAYHEVLAQSVRPYKPELLVTVINGAFRNMGPAEAAHLAKQLGVRVVIPCHYDLFPGNCQPPQMLRTGLILEGIGGCYQELIQGVPFTFASCWNDRIPVACENV